MTKTEWLQLQLGDYVYRETDGWGGELTSAPGNRDIKDWSDAQTLSFKSYIDYPKDWQNHSLSAKAIEHEQWHKMNVETCTNALALARFSIYQSARLIDALTRTTIL